MLKFSQQKKDKIRDHHSENALFFRRVLIILVVFLMISAGLIYNLYRLQIIEHGEYATRSNNNRVKLLPITPPRGIIYDRNNKVLAYNLTSFGLYITPEKINNLAETFTQLNSIVGLTDDDIEEFKNSRKNATAYSSLLLKKELSEQQIARFAVNQHLFPDIEIRPYYTRYYPYKEFSAHVLGYVAKINDKDIASLKEKDQLYNYRGISNIGRIGLEKYYEDDLHGKVGFEQVEVNSRGKVVRSIYIKPAIAGKNITLTLDLDLQQHIYNLFHDRKGSVVVMDPNDGGILAMVSNPTYDNNSFVNGISSRKYNELLFNPDHPLYNRALQSIYPPGSTVKPFISIAALEEKIITADEKRYSPGEWYLPNTTTKYRDFRPGGNGNVNLRHAIAVSADTYYYQIAYQLGIDKLSNWMQLFGFGVTTGIDIHEENSGIMPNREWKQKRFKQSWLQGDTISVGIGQGYWSTTPLHLAKALTVLINNGQIKTPHFLLAKGSNGQTELYQDPKLYPDIKLKDEKHWLQVKQGMYDVINNKRGTGYRTFANSNYTAAGKSGTAQVFSLRGAKYDAKSLAKELHDHAWFIAYAPYEKPEIVVVVMLENAGFGASSSAPMARDIIDFYLNQQNQRVINNGE